MDSSDNELIEQIYASTQDSSMILKVGKRIAVQSGGFMAYYLKMDMEQRAVVETQIESDSLLAADADYVNYYASVDSRIPWFATGTLGQWRPDQQRFDEAYVNHSEIYNDFLQPNGIKRVAVCKLRESPKIHEVLCVTRAHDAGDFSQAQLDRLAVYSRHLVQAARLRARLGELEIRRAAAQGALEHLPYGVLWIDATQRIIWMSPSTHACLDPTDTLYTRSQRLHCTDLKDQERLQQALKRATGTVCRAGDYFALPRRKRVGTWVVSVIPGELPEDYASRQRGPFALVILQDGAGPTLPHQKQLQLLHDLTPAEARLALGLLQDLTPAEYAERHCLSLATVKTHLQHLFLKTGVRRQAELVRRLALPLPHSDF